MTAAGVESLCNALAMSLERQKTKLVAHSAELCSVDPADSELDFQYALACTRHFPAAVTAHLESAKPKGRVGIMLSYNEPIGCGVAPVLAALASGNEVLVRPSQRCAAVLRSIWEAPEVARLTRSTLEILEIPREAMTSVVANLNALCFFGSRATASTLARSCAEHLVEFMPHTETSDVRIVDTDTVDLAHAARESVNEAFYMRGQSCQRPQGVVAVGLARHAFCSEMQAAFREFHAPKSWRGDPLASERIRACRLAERENVQVHLGLDRQTVLFTGVRRGHSIVQESFFFPSIWLSAVASLEELFELLRVRPWGLGVNLISSRPDFIDSIVQKTRFTRYTVNRSHVRIGATEGWGGSWPCGWSGKTSWFRAFSIPFEISPSGRDAA